MNKATIITCAALLLSNVSLASAAADISGTVFWDKNGNGLREKGEPGIAGVSVSNSREVVQSNGQGRYTLPAYDEMAVFISKPAGYAPPLGENNIPRFFYIHQPAGSPPEIQQYPGLAPTGPLPASIDFPLHKVREADSFKAVFLGDTQVYNDTELAYFRDTTVKEVAESDAVVAVTLGDNIGDKLSLYPRFISVMKELGIPYYLTAGNHDMNLDAPDDAHSLDTFKSQYGPAYYSFNYGRVHFVVLDSIVYPSTLSSSYHGEIDDTQLQWLINDLRQVPKDRLIVLNMHIPLVSYIDRLAANHQVNNREEIYELLAGRRVLSLGGHTHTLEHFQPGDEEEGWGQPTPITQIIVGASCGSWWSGDFTDAGVPFSYQRDGGPKGHMIIEFNGNQYTDSFKASGLAADRQMNLSLRTDSFLAWYEALRTWQNSDPASRPAAPPVTLHDLGDQRVLTPEDLTSPNLALVANIWNGSTASQVTCQYDDRLPEQAQRDKNTADPFALRTQAYVFRYADGFTLWNGTQLPAPPQPLPPFLQTTGSTHVWTCAVPDDLTPGSHQVRVQSTDVHNNISAEKLVFEVKD